MENKLPFWVRSTLTLDGPLFPTPTPFPIFFKTNIYKNLIYKIAAVIYDNNGLN